MDRLDRKIVEALQADGRLTNLELAQRIGLSPSPCLRRVRHLETSGVIEGYSARISRRAVGMDLTVFVSVNIDRHGEDNAERFRAVIAAMAEVTACWIVSGESDFLLQVVVPNFDAYRGFVLDRLLKTPGVKDIQSSFAIDVIKEGAPLSLGHIR